MGNCSNVSKNSGSGNSAKGSITLQSGERIEFDGSLSYGRDSIVSGVVRGQIENWENKRRNSKIEFAYSVTPDGTVIGEKRGGKGSVRVPVKMHDTEGAAFTHIHPREDGGLGGTFSVKDLENFAKYKNVTERAAAKEGTYSISKLPNFNRDGFLRMAKDSYDKRRADYRERNRSIANDYKGGKISYDTAKQLRQKAFNTYLAERHQDLLAGQKTYGYTYALEKV